MWARQMLGTSSALALTLHSGLLPWRMPCAGRHIVELTQEINRFRVHVLEMGHTHAAQVPSGGWAGNSFVVGWSAAALPHVYEYKEV